MSNLNICVNWQKKEENDTNKEELIKGDIYAGGSVTCGNVSGDIDAGGSVRCRR